MATAIRRYARQDQTKLQSHPNSLLAGVEAIARRTLGIANVKHRSGAFALLGREVLPSGIVEAIFETLAGNWVVCRAARPSTRSTQNWRWRTPQLAIAPYNASPEVVLERAIVAAFERAGRTDVSNQVPVASGVAGPFGERRRAIDLVQQRGPDHFELIELKVGSDTPVYAAVEIIGYACIWLLSHLEAGADASPLLMATTIDARVLAPASYYGRYPVQRFGVLLNAEMAALGERHGVSLSFGFESFEDHLARGPFTEAGLLAVLDDRRPV